VVHQGGRAEETYKSEASQTFNARSEHRLKPEDSSKISRLFTTSFYGAVELEDLHI